MGSRTANVMVVGKTGSGKTVNKVRSFGFSWRSLTPASLKHCIPAMMERG